MDFKDDSFRIDFVITEQHIDPETRRFHFVLEPHPDRYEWQEVNGEQMLFDRLDDTYITHECLRRACEQARGLPIYYEPALIEDAHEYVASRVPAIEAMLDGEPEHVALADKSADFLEALADQDIGFVILSVDVVESTEKATGFPPRQYGMLMRVLLHELSEIVPKFRGHVLNYTGDGFIAYFAAPSVMGKCDLAIDSALTLHRLVYDTLNPLLKERGLPALQLRIGLDVDEAPVMIIGSPTTKRQPDIIGSVVSIAAKIQGMAEPGDICLGEAVERNLHTDWRAVCEPIELDPTWPFRTREGQAYAVYRVRRTPD